MLCTTGPPATTLTICHEDPVNDRTIQLAHICHGTALCVGEVVELFSLSTVIRIWTDSHRARRSGQTDIVYVHAPNENKEVKSFPNAEQPR